MKHNFLKKMITSFFVRMQPECHGQRDEPGGIY